MNVQLHTHGAIPSGETALGTQCIGGWKGPRAGPKFVEKKIIPYLYQELIII
jgi:hypothetical protein